MSEEMTPERRARIVVAQLANYDYDFSEAINSKNVLMIADIIRAAIGQELIENDRLAAERDALSARVAAYEAALGSAWMADEGATAGEWKPTTTIREHVVACGSIIVATIGDRGGMRAKEDARLVATAVNAVRAVREVRG